MIRIARLITTAISLYCAGVYAAGAFELSVRVQNAGSALEPESQLCGLSPRGLNGQQYQWQLTSPARLEHREGQYCLTLDALGPYQSQTVPVQWRPMAKRDSEQRDAPSSYDLVADPSPALVDLARSFEQYPEQVRVERIFQWMLRNIAFSGIRRGIDGAEHALLQKQGDCSEHMLLAGELLQRNGITIRRVLGVAIPKDQHRITAPSLHNWIEYKDNGSWLVFDSSRQVLGAPDQLSYISLLFYESSLQLSSDPLTIDSAQLKLYLQ